MDRDPSDRRILRERRVYENINELELELEQEEENFKSFLDKLIEESKEQQNALQKLINQSGSNHNNSVNEIFGQLPSVSLPIAFP